VLGRAQIRALRTTRSIRTLSMGGITHAEGVPRLRRIGGEFHEQHRAADSANAFISVLPANDRFGLRSEPSCHPSVFPGSRDVHLGPVGDH
jgi:hypothetical protein